ncbi:MAG: cytochrome c [Deltaproteobacteria bacterium]|nr:cytochrome c [Deltaproteobacteria bacterium]
MHFLQLSYKITTGRRVATLAMTMMSIVLLFACTAKKNEGTDRGSSSSAVEKGKALYNTKCTVCHNPDPSKPGAVGPEIAASSIELIRLKTRENKYPQGYTPKRQTLAMTAMPELSEEDVKALHEYLNSQ